jgi:hypothetical protein
MHIDITETDRARLRAARRLGSDAEQRIAEQIVANAIAADVVRGGAHGLMRRTKRDRFVQDLIARERGR